MGVFFDKTSNVGIIAFSMSTQTIIYSVSEKTDSETWYVSCPPEFDQTGFGQKLKAIDPSKLLEGELRRLFVKPLFEVLPAIPSGTQVAAQFYLPTP